MNPHIRALCFAGAIIASLAPTARATMLVERMSLERVTREAGRIVHGKVVAIESRRDESGLPATWITLDVITVLKGWGAGSITIKQYGVTQPLPDGTITRVAGLPRYRVGEEVVLFLRHESERGFTSPVGLGQGVYRVSHKTGRAQVRRDLAEAGSGAKLGEKRDLDELLNEVAQHVALPR